LLILSITSLALPFSARLQRAASFSIVIQTFHVWLPSACRFAANPPTPEKVKLLRILKANKRLKEPLRCAENKDLRTSTRYSIE
jgi:hypothetical protein